MPAVVVQGVALALLVVVIAGEQAKVHIRMLLVEGPIPGENCVSFVYAAVYEPAAN